MVQNWKRSHYEEACKTDVNISFICLEAYISGSFFFFFFFFACLSKHLIPQNLLIKSVLKVNEIIKPSSVY